MRPEVYELWKSVSGLEEKYEVSNFGRIKNKRTGRVRKTPTGKRGYPVFSAKREDGKFLLITVHSCVAKAFLPNPNNLPQVNHIDGNKENNFLTNLEWCTAQENNLHARKMGLHKSDGDKPVLQKDDFGNVIAIYKSISEASRKTKIARCNIGAVIHGYNYNGHKQIRAGGYRWEFE